MRKTDFDSVCKVVEERISVAGSVPFYKSLGTYKSKEYVDNEGIKTVVYSAYRYFEALGRDYGCVVTVKDFEDEVVVSVSSTTYGLVAHIHAYSDRDSNKTKISVFDGIRSDDIVYDKCIFAMFLLARDIESHI